MKRLPWLLFLLSVLVSLIAVISRFGPRAVCPGIANTTWWKAAMALLAYAATLKILSMDEKRSA
ncbi:MAG: hypothetical protein U0167_08695 [bacterium]